MYLRMVVLSVFLSILSIPVFADEPDTVLLVRDSSDFKDALADDLREILSAEGYSVAEEDSMRFLKKIDPFAYTAIIIVNTGKAGRPHSMVRDFLDKDGALPSTVVLTTYSKPSGSRYVYADRPGVDGITSASPDDRAVIRDLARGIVSRLELE